MNFRAALDAALLFQGVVLKFWGVLLFCTLSVSSAWSRTIVVSDIDDTLKISYVRSLTDKVLNAPRTDLVFAGMPEPFLALQNRGDVEFIYLSNAPTWLMTEAHQVFCVRTASRSAELSCDQREVAQRLLNAKFLIV